MEQSAAQVFWRGLLEKHPNFAGILAIVQDIAVFFLYGHVVKKVGQWIIIASGIVAETVLLFSAVWVTIVNVAQDFVLYLLGDEVVHTASWLSLIAFSVLPEIILFSAVVKTYQLWIGAWRNGWRGLLNSYTAWGAIYTIMTVCFCTITLITIGSFVDTGGHAAALTGSMLVFRCLLGWGYGLIELVYASVGKQNHPDVLQVAPLQSIQIEEKTNALAEQIQALSERLSEQKIEQLIEQKVTSMLQESERSIEHFAGRFAEQQKAFEELFKQQFDELAKRLTQTAHSERSESANSEQISNTSLDHAPSNPQAHTARSEHYANRTQKRSKKSASTKRKSAYDKVFDVIKNKRDMSVSEIVSRTGLSKGTVSPIRTQILKQINGSIEQSPNKKEPITGEIEAVRIPPNEQSKSNGKGHGKTELKDLVEMSV